MTGERLIISIIAWVVALLLFATFVIVWIIRLLGLGMGLWMLINLAATKLVALVRACCSRGYAPAGTSDLGALESGGSMEVPLKGMLSKG